MRKYTRIIELPIEPEMVVKIVSNIEDLFNKLSFVSSISGEEKGYTIEFSVKGVIRGFQDKYSVTGAFDPKNRAYVVIGHGRRSNFALVVTPRKGRPNTVVKIDFYLDRVSGGVAKKIGSEVIEKLVDYLWLKTREYLEELHVKEKAVVEESRRETVEAKTVVEEVVSREAGREVEAGREEAKEEVGVEAGISREYPVEVDTSSLDKYNSILEDVIEYARLLLNASLVVQQSFSSIKELFDKIHDLAREYGNEYRYLLVTIKSGKLESRILVDTSSGKVVGAILSVDETMLSGVEAFEKLSSIEASVEAKIWGIKSLSG